MTRAGDRLPLTLLLFLACLVFPTIARADGLIIIDRPPRPIPGHFPFAPMEVTYHRVSVSIDDQVATTSVDQEFRNSSGARLEGFYMFPLPDGAAIDKFSMDIDGKEMEAELLPADKARQIYEEIVRRHRDPALLEYVGKGAFRVRIFPIEPNSTKRVRLKYTQLLKADSGLVEYTYPLNTEKFSARPLKDVSVKVDLHCKRAIKSVYSPSHSVDIRRHGDRSATIGYEERDARPDTDFKLIFSRTDDPVGIDLLTYRTSPDEGYFLLLASPGMDAAGKVIQDRDVCFVLDTSGSMAGPKMEQAKRALNFCLANLNAGDRFEIIRFSTEAEGLFDGLVSADKDHVTKAREFVDSMKPIGGTAIDDALQKAIALRGTGVSPVHGRDAHATEYEVLWKDRWYPASVLKRDGGRAFIHYDGYEASWDEWVGPDRIRVKNAPPQAGDRPYVVIFLTDGQPTIGETKEDPIVDRTKRLGGNVRIFSFGIGTDVNTHLLDRIAGETKAFSQYVLPTEDIEVKVSNFYGKIASPVLTSVQLSVLDGNVNLRQVYPPTLPDLYKGDTLMVFGRYTGSGRATVALSGTCNGKEQRFRSDVNFTDSDRTDSFIPRLWATRRVGWLLDEIRMHGESKELKDEVVRLAREHGIVTPYTAYLILEDEAKRGVPRMSRSFRELEDDGFAMQNAREQYESARADSPALERAGGRAVANSASVQALKDGAYEHQAQLGIALDKSQVAGPAPMAQPEGYRARQSQNYAQQVRVARGKTFYQNANTWSDAEGATRQNLKNRQVAFNSDEYFALIRDNPDAAAWLSLGNEVDVVIADTLYQIR
jgi:Ca-activated chloride channel family protein